MRVRFWGVRGSTPTPQKENMGYGGNTSCIEIRTDTNQILIFDGGTGIRLLGKELQQEFGDKPINAHIFFSHFHLDHIQGVPFFRPLYNPRNHFTFYFAGRRDANLVMDALAGMMANPYFPVDMSKLPCSREYVDLVEGTFTVADTQNSGAASESPPGLRRLSHHAKRKGHFLLHGRRTRSRLERQEHDDAGQRFRFLHRRFAVHAGRIARDKPAGDTAAGNKRSKPEFRPASNVSLFIITIPTTKMATSRRSVQSALKIASQRDRSPRRPRSHSVVNSDTCQ